MRQAAAAVRLYAQAMVWTVLQLTPEVPADCYSDAWAQASSDAAQPVPMASLSAWAWELPSAHPAQSPPLGAVPPPVVKTA